MNQESKKEAKSGKNWSDPVEVDAMIKEKIEEAKQELQDSINEVVNQMFTEEKLKQETTSISREVCREMLQQREVALKAMLVEEIGRQIEQRKTEQLKER